LAQKAFGNKSTVKKLQTLTDYLDFYTTALNGKFRLNYFDAFAGTGEIPYGSSLTLFEGIAEIETVIEGSARRSLKLRVPFNRYYFSDGKLSNANDLEKLRVEFPSLASSIFTSHGDANDKISHYCKFNNLKNDRTVFFLDPYGNQVKWSTIEDIAQTEGSDLWYLFPAGLGVVRQMSKDAKIQKDAETSLNMLFGDNTWFDALTEQTFQPDMLDPTLEVRRKIATSDAVTRFMIKKMKSVFKGKVLDSWLPLGKAGGHWYSLIFACSNKNPKAHELATRVARDIMRRK
jgi:three-Cys-motif partner protein